MKELTRGDVLHVYGSFGLNMDYTVRLCVRMKDEINGEMLSEAVRNTSKRYPYLSLQMKRDENRIYYEDNPKEIALINDNKRISLNSEESNYHVWAVCYRDDFIYLDIYHGLLDGTGMYMVLSTLLYEYCSRRYGVTDHKGVRTLEDEVRPEEAIDPMDYLPEIDLSNVATPSYTPAFSLEKDAGFHTTDLNLMDIEISEADFLKYTSANDASPGTMIALLNARVIDSLYPDRDKKIMGSYIINARPMLGASITHHNCVSTVFLDYSDKIRNMPFDRQCTVYRGKTFIQSDSERVAGAMTFSANRNRLMLDSAPTLAEKYDVFARSLSGGRLLFTYMVSYVGKWKYKAVEEYISEFWTHVPSANALLTEVAAVGGRIFLTVHQRFEEDIIIQSLLDELKRNGISYKVHKHIPADNAHFPLP